MSQSGKVLHGLMLERFQEIFEEERKDWLLPPNYLNNDNKNTTGVTSPKPPVKEEPITD